MKRGFTLIEVMVVVAIIGILAALALPMFSRFQCAAQQSEVRKGLNVVATFMESYHGEHHGFVANGAYFDSQVATLIKGKERYQFNLISGGPINYEVEGVGQTGLVAGDLWNLTQDRNPTELVNVCK